MRYKDFTDMIKSIEKPESGSLEELNSFYLAMIATCVCDMAKSLALLADSSEAGKLIIEADVEKRRTNEVDDN